MKAHVALTHGADRADNVDRALRLIAEDVDLRGARQIVVKVNFISHRFPLASTHVDAARATIAFLKERTDAPVYLAAGSGTGEPASQVALERFGYLPVLRRYGVRFVDLNRDAGVPVTIVDRHWQDKTVLVARTMVEADVRVSVAIPKTHDVTVATLSFKNCIMGSLLRDDSAPSERLLQVGWKLAPTWLVHSRPMARVHAKGPSIRGNHKVAMHQGWPQMAVNLFRVGQLTYPHLSVLDGYQGMEGEGPVEGSPVDLRVALASPDFVAADTVAAKLMGIDIGEIGYLEYARRAGMGEGDLDRIRLSGERWQDHARRFRRHPTHGQQVAWTLPAERMAALGVPGPLPEEVSA